MTWKSGEDGIRGYKFTYDNMSRMRNAIYGEGTSITPPTGKNFSENVIGYDYNGNITGLQRYGKVSGSTYGKMLMCPDVIFPNYQVPIFYIVETV